MKAFPITVREGNKTNFNEGMDLRDWFAGHRPEIPENFMQISFPTPQNYKDKAEYHIAVNKYWKHQAYRYSEWSIMYADAMLAAREGGNGD